MLASLVHKTGADSAAYVCKVNIFFANVHTRNKDLGQSMFVSEVHIIRSGARTEVSLDPTPLGFADHVWPDYILQLDK